MEECKSKSKSCLPPWLLTPLSGLAPQVCGRLVLTVSVSATARVPVVVDAVGGGAARGPGVVADSGGGAARDMSTLLLLLPLPPSPPPPQSVTVSAVFLCVGGAGCAGGHFVFLH